MIQVGIVTFGKHAVTFANWCNDNPEMARVITWLDILFINLVFMVNHAPYSK